MACCTQRYAVDGREMGDIPDADNFLCPNNFVLNIWKHYKQEWIIGVFKAEQGTVPMATKMYIVNFTMCVEEWGMTATLL